MAYVSSPKIQVDISRLADRLMSLGIGEILSYAEASKIIGREIREAGNRYVLYKAIKDVEQDGGSRFGTIAKQGVKRLEGVEFVGIGSDGRKRLRRAAVKIGKRLTGAHQSDIPAQDYKLMSAQRALMGIIAHYTRPSIEKKIESKITTVGAGTDISEIMTMLASKGRPHRTNEVPTDDGAPVSNYPPSIVDDLIQGKADLEARNAELEGRLVRFEKAV